MRKHPSGKPTPNRIRRPMPIYRIPDKGYLTPSLKRDEIKTEALGYVVHGEIEAEDEE